MVNQPTYMQLSGDAVVRTEAFSPAVLVDCDKHGLVVGIEFLGPVRNVNLAALARRYSLSTIELLKRASALGYNE